MRYLYLLIGMILLPACERPVDSDQKLKGPPDPVLLNLPAPILVSPNNGRYVWSGDRILLHWREIASVDSYSVMVSMDSNFTLLILSETIDSTFIRTPVLFPGWHFWRVRATKVPYQTSPWSEVRSFQMRPLPIE